MSNTIGTIDVTIRIFLDMDLDQEDAQAVVDNIEVTGWGISHTETIGNNIKEKGS